MQEKDSLFLRYTERCPSSLDKVVRERGDLAINVQKRLVKLGI